MTRFYVMCRWTALAVVAMLALAGCDDWIMGGVPGSGAPGTARSETQRSRYETTSITVRAATPLRAAAAAGSHSDVASVSVTVAGPDANGQHQDSLATATLTQTAGAWSGTVSELTVGKALTFSAKAFSASNVRLFEGTTTATLNSSTSAVTISLTSVDDGAASRIPLVTAITAANVEAEAAGTVQVSVTGTGNEDVDYEFFGPSFLQGTGSITLASGRGTISHSYTAPEDGGRYLARVQLSNAQGNGVEVDFEVVVTASQSDAITLNAGLGPVVTALTGKRTTAGVRWMAEVSAQGSGETYAWSFSGTGSFSDATTNPTLLTGYAASTTGTLKVTVTDAAGLSTVASLALTAGMFPDTLVRRAAELVINEIDYDTPNTGDPDEFIEIYNPGSSAIDLAGYRFELVNGSNGDTYATFTYSGNTALAGRGYLVITKKQTIYDAASEPKELVTESLQNGPDAIRIVEVATGRVVDAVHYKGPVAGAGEGSPAGSDSGTASKSIGRCANGFDSDDNSIDFRSMDSTPGAANTCS